MKNNRFNILKTTAMRNAWVVVFVVAGTTLTATSCADDDGAVASGSRQKVQLLVSVPTQTAAASQHRLADPGTAVPEGTDWDRLTVILAYADGSRVIKTTLTKEEFEALADYENQPGVKLLTIDAWLGEAYIYGVTYSSTATGNPEHQRLPEQYGRAGSDHFQHLCLGRCSQVCERGYGLLSDQ